jgi:hypothetical protein
MVTQLPVVSGKFWVMPNFLLIVWKMAFGGDLEISLSHFWHRKNGEPHPSKLR